MMEYRLRSAGVANPNAKRRYWTFVQIALQSQSKTQNPSTIQEKADNNPKIEGQVFALKQHSLVARLLCDLTNIRQKNY
jgi:hypothetical protein